MTICFLPLSICKHSFLFLLPFMSQSVGIIRSQVLARELSWISMMGYSQSVSQLNFNVTCRSSQSKVGPVGLANSPKIIRGDL